MAFKVKMPKFGETMTEGTIYKWLKEEGEGIKEGEPLFEVETDKAALEVEAPATGILARILVKEGETVSIGKQVAVITEKGEDIENINIIREDNEYIEDKENSDKIDNIEEENREQKEIEQFKSKIKASPAARRLAREKGIKLSGIQPGDGREVIIEEDILSYLPEETDHKREDKETPAGKYPFSHIKKVTAQNMLKSYREIPHVTLTMEINMEETVKFKNKLREISDSHITYTDIIVMITARAIAKNNYINSHYRKDGIDILKNINVGIAVDTENGLLVPVIKDVDKLNLEKIAEQREDLVKRARKGKLKKEEMEEGTFTVTNLGNYNIEIFTPIINPGEAAILGVGTIKEKPVAIDGKILIKPVMWLSLSFDHRIVDGAYAAQFLEDIKNLLESPLSMLLS